MEARKFEVDIERDPASERKNPLLEFGRGFIAGASGADPGSNLRLWIPALLLLFAEIVLPAEWLMHPAWSSLWSTAWKMACLAAPYAIGLSLLGDVNRMVNDGQVTAQTQKKLQERVSWLLFVYYLLFPAGVLK